MNKKITTLAIALMMTTGNTIAFADHISVNHVKEIEQLKVSDLLTESRFKDLDIDMESLQVFMRLEQMNESKGMMMFSALSNYDDYNDIKELYGNLGDVWGNLTDSEKELCIKNPASAALAYYNVKEANKLTIQEYGHNRIGDESDAFRHTVWNALMQKYIGGSFPSKYATAHEDYPEEDLQKKSKNSRGEYDGYKLQDHTDMDLHNNAVGRSLVKWTEYFTISHEEIVKRVHKAIDNGDCYYLYNYEE